MDKITRINEQIYLGPEDIARRPGYLKDLGIQHIFNFADEVVYHIPHHMGFHIHYYPIKHDEDASLLGVLDDAIQSIYNCVSQQKCVYLHCTDGNSRAAALAIYYLMLYEHMNFDDALGYLEELRPQINLHPNFVQELRAIGS
jgi:protein-tyrosine phosphatase